MKNNQFSVHKSMVLSNRKALALYLIKLNHIRDVAEIMSQSIDLDGFDGDRVPLDVVTNEINLAAHLLQDEYLGLKVINLIDIEFLPLYQGIKLCITPLLNTDIKIPLIVLCRLITRYFKVITESIQVHLIEETNLLRLDFHPSMPEQVNHHQTDGVMLAVHKILSAFSSIKPTKLTLSYRQSSHGIELYKQLFGVPAELSSTTNSLYYALKINPNIQLDLLSVAEFSKTLENAFFIGPLHNMLDKEFPDSSYTERCQHILVTIMGLNEPTREQVAQVLNMSVSSLQRRLREEGISFQQILLATRKMMANKYLIEQKLSASDVTFLLGYQSSSQFFKAFKRWYSMTPMVYQKLHRGDA